MSLGWFFEVAFLAMGANMYVYMSIWEDSYDIDDILLHLIDTRLSVVSTGVYQIYCDNALYVQSF